MKKLILTLSLFPILSFANGLGLKAPIFSLKDMNSKIVSLSDFKKKYVVLEWTNHGCPFVKKHYNSNNMQSIQKKIVSKDTVWLSIISSANGKQGHSTPAKALSDYKEMKSNATSVLLDTDGKVGGMYGAKTTPHMFIINPKGIVIYEGAIDSIASADKTDIDNANNFILSAFQEIRSGKEVSTKKTKPYGCSVKY
jgi:peroxiredoxin